MPGNLKHDRLAATPATAVTSTRIAPANREMTIECDIGIGHSNRYVVLVDENGCMFVSMIAPHITPIDAIHSAALAVIGAGDELSVLTVKCDMMDLSGLRKALEQSLPGVRIELQQRSSAVVGSIERKLRKAIEVARTAS